MAAIAEGPFRVLQHRNYRLFWFGFIISNSGAWIQSVAQGWLVYELSGSAVWLGAIGFVRAFPLIVLALIGGAAADRFPKRRILFATQAAQLVSALTLGTLTALGVIQVWHVLVLALVTGAAHAFDQPARHSLVPSLVSKADLHAAISLNAIAFNGAGAFGPSLTGLLVPWIGLAGCFFLNAASFLAVFVALLLMEFPPQYATVTRHQGMAADVVEGLKYVRQSRIILALISMAAINSFFARPFQQFLTVFAADVHQSGIGLAGLMQGALSVGTIIFMLFMASLGAIQWKGKLLIGSGFAFGAGMIAFAWVPNPVLALGLLVAVGGFSVTWMTTVNTLLQENVADTMRGRVMSTYTVTAMAMMPLGQGPMGWSVETVGPEWTLTLGAMISSLWIAYMAFVRVPEVHRLP